jgi:hypothetical protein
VAGAGLVATFLLAWTFLALAVAGPAAHLGGGGAPPAAPAVERLARAGE